MIIPWFLVKYTLIKVLPTPLPHSTSAQPCICGLILKRQKLRPRGGNGQSQAPNSGLFSSKSKIFSHQASHGAFGLFSISSQWRILPINPYKGTQRASLKVSCFALGSPFPVLPSWLQGEETTPQFTRDSETATDTGPVSKVAHHACARAGLFARLSSPKLAWLSAASLPGQRALRWGGRPLTKRGSSFSNGLVHNLGSNKWGPSLAQIMSTHDKLRPSPPGLDWFLWMGKQPYGLWSQSRWMRVMLLLLSGLVIHVSFSSPAILETLTNFSSAFVYWANAAISRTCMGKDRVESKYHATQTLEPK